MSCEKCQDGYIYWCSNCYEDIYYDSEFGCDICNTCSMLGEKFYSVQSPCPDCNADEDKNDIININGI